MTCFVVQVPSTWIKKDGLPSLRSTVRFSLSVVMAKWGAEAIAERDALRKRLDELKKIYPHHFLTEADIGNRETGTFQIVADWSRPDQDSRVVYMGRTEDGNYLWKWKR